MKNFDGRKRILRHIERYDRLDKAREAMIQRIEVFEKNSISEYEKVFMTQRSVETRRSGQCRPDALVNHINNSLLEEKSIDNNSSLVNTNALTKEKQTACAVSGRGSSETPCSASAGIGWRSKSKGKTSSPEPHDSPDSLRKTESSSPENIFRNSRCYGITMGIIN